MQLQFRHISGEYENHAKQENNLGGNAESGGDRRRTGSAESRIINGDNEPCGHKRSEKRRQDNSA